MKKYGWIVIVGVVLLAAFGLLKRSDERVSEKAVPASASVVVDSPETEAVSQSVPKADSSVRIPLPTPELPELSRDLVPMHLHPLFGWKDIGGYVPRRRLVQSLKHELSDDEVRAMLMFVRSRPEEVGLSDEDFNGVGDVVLLKLEEQKFLHPDYTDHLVVMFYDESLNTQWRDYCIQHLGTVYPRTPADKRPVIEQLYADAMQPGSEFAGTALLSMKRSTDGNGLSREWVAEKAMGVADSTAYSDAERLSALAVAAKFNHPEAVALAREIAPSKRAITFRMASLAVLGTHGDASDRSLLEEYAKSSDIRLRTAASEALKRLNHGIQRSTRKEPQNGK